MTDLACLDGRQVGAISDRLAAVYRAAMGAEPFHETEVETGFFTEELAGELDEAGFRCWVASEDDQVVGFAYGYETPDIPPDGWYGLVREAVGPDVADHWLAGQFAVVWIAVRPDRRGRGLGRELLGRLLAGAGTERAWLITHDLGTPARALYGSLGVQELGPAPSAGTTPNGSCSGRAVAQQPAARPAGAGSPGGGGYLVSRMKARRCPQATAG
jgi:ribosomal protein S18 acetylase RimI-like enzyme